MRLAAILIAILLFKVCAAGNAQVVTLNLKNVTLEQCFRDICKQTGYTFFYEKQMLEKEKLVTVSVNRLGLAEALSKILDNRPLTYMIVDQTVVIKAHKPVPGQVSAQLKVVVPAPVIIRGKVTDSEGRGVEGVTVQVKNDVHATVSGADGTFAITVPDIQTAVLIFSHINMQGAELAVRGRSAVEITLESKLVEQQEVVIVGYGTQKKANVTGAVSTVKVEELLGNRPVSTTGALLQGAAPGLQVNIGSGEPGAGASFNIRGATDIQAGSNAIRTTGPFIIVDNMPFNGPLNLLDPNDIETITVLKDAGSAAIYGARSAFGVVLITTKKGAKNQKVRFDYSNNMTMVQATNLPRKATVEQTVQSYKDMGALVYWTGNDVEKWLGLIAEYNQDASRYPEGYTMIDDVRYPLRSYDAMKNLLGSNPLQFMHNLSVSGGSEKTTYRFSVGTVKEAGVLAPQSRQDMYRRHNFKSFVNTEVKKWLTIQADAAYYNSYKSYPITDGLNTAINFAPYIPMEDSLEINGVKYLSESPRNVVSMRAPSVDKTDDIRLTGRIILKPLEGLSLTAEYTHDHLQVRNTFYQKIITAADPRQYEVVTRGQGLFRKINETTDYNAFNVFANYDRKLKRHEFSVMTGLNVEESLYEQERMERDGVISADYPSISQATGVPVAVDNYNEFAVYGVFGRLNYNFAGKYLLGLTGRYDASSRFPAGHRSGFFPSVSGGWVITKEKLLAGLPRWINEIKLRASYGAVGNQAIPEYAFFPSMDASYANWLVANSQVTTLSPPGLVSSNFTWATVQTLDFGLDLGLFKNRLTASVDWYRRDTKDMLYEGVQLPSILGTGAPLQNVAALQTRGFEAELSWRDQIGGLGYRIGVNVFDSKGRITKIKNEAGLLSQYYVGQELGEIWGYTTDRLYTVDDFVAGSLNDNLTGGQLKEGIARREGQLPNPGDVLYVDYDGNGIVNAGNNTLSDPGDRRIIGNSTPRYRYNINAGFNFKGFDLSFVINGVMKARQWRANQLTFPNFYNFGTIYADQLDYWTPVNLDAHYARIYDQSAGNQSFNQAVQTRYLQNGAFLRMKNISLAYSIPVSLIRKIALERVQTFISVENAFTFHHLSSGLDPDINRAGDQGFGYPFLRLYSIGFNVSF